MSKKRFKHKKLPICYKFINNDLYNQNIKVIETKRIFKYRL